MHNSNNGRFDALSERSLLGMLGARERCRRSPSTRVQVLRQIVDLYNRVIHPSDPDDAVDAARSLLRLLRDVGYHDAGYKERAERVLAEAFPSRELEAVVRMARTVSGQASGDDRQSDDVTGSAHASAALIRQLQARSPGVAKPPADLADLIALNATGAQLAGVDLCGARLFDADLSGAQLAGANLSDTVLFGADLSDTILAGADLCGALLAGADLSDTVLA
ncbi:pentapeptide repeat-containing protein, partial [Frankia sp. CiP3]|uniref:pentapeptide repeat-containing protein n=1 Tax=Frankia sp. CiP3 TaxID=2880971 RepID=UPI001EF6643B